MTTDEIREGGCYISDDGWLRLVQSIDRESLVRAVCRKRTEERWTGTAVATLTVFARNSVREIINTVPTETERARAERATL